MISSVLIENGEGRKRGGKSFTMPSEHNPLPRGEKKFAQGKTRRSLQEKGGFIHLTLLSKKGTEVTLAVILFYKTIAR